MDIEIGDITIEAHQAIWTSKMEVRASINRIKAPVVAYADGVEIVADLNLMEAYHPDLKAHCDAIRQYMEQEARRLFVGGQP